MIDFKKLERALVEPASLALTCHVNPDADAIGSETALRRALVAIGKEVRIVNFNETPDNLRFLDPDDAVERYDPERHDDYLKNVNLLVCVDCNQLNRLAKMEPVARARSKPIICVDHHQDPEYQAFADVFVQNDYAAVGHIVYDLIVGAGWTPIDRALAEPLYAAIMTDTGSFRYERTTPTVHRVAAALLEAGVDPERVNEEIHNRSALARVKLLGETIGSLELRGDGGLATARITRETLAKCGASETDTDGFVNVPLTVNGVAISLLFMELREGFKVNLRSKGAIPIHELAREYGGGGHRNAAGIRIFDRTMEELREEIIRRGIDYLEKGNHDEKS